MDEIGGEPGAARLSLEGFKPLTVIMEVLGGLAVVLVAIWTFHFRGGFAWSSAPDFQFNWHPLLMTFGLVFLYGNAMLIYRTQRSMRKRRLKLMHAGLMLFIIVLAIVALVAVFDSHNLKKPEPIPNMYSLHSWVGLTTVILFSCQWLAGFLSFLYPGIQQSLRTSYMPIHVYFGTSGFVGAIAACLLGLNEKAIFSVKEYSLLVPEGIMINVIGLLLILFGGVTIYLVTQERYRRLARPEDDALITGRS